jgi:DNA-binding beta-propeller fold protein YncE
MAVDSRAHTLYVMDSFRDLVYVLDTKTCNASRQDGCVSLASISVPGAIGIAVNPRTHTVYVSQYFAGTLAVIHGRRCQSSDVSGCASPLVTAPAGERPFQIQVDQTTNTVYVANDNADTITLLPGAACDLGQSSCQGLAQTQVGLDPESLTSDPASHTLFVANQGFGGPGTVSVVDTRACNANDTTGCQTAWPAVATGSSPRNVTVDRKARTAFVVVADSTVRIINIRRCSAISSRGCADKPRQVIVGTLPVAATADPRRHTVYVTNAGDGTTSIIDSRHPCRRRLCST